jgi:3-oxoacyl-[acyl-carrier protein] reductase
MAIALAEAGAKVVLASPETESLQQLAADIDSRCGTGAALAVTTDITQLSDCEKLLTETLDAFGGFHILINCARRMVRGPGLGSSKKFLPFWEVDPELWESSFRVNVNGSFYVTRALAPHLVKQGWGRIINITTSLDTMQQRSNSPYGITKVALEAATLIWSQDLLDTGVTVNSLIPGRKVNIDPATPPEEASKLLPVTIMNAAAVWLCSDLSNGKTGGRYVGELWDPSLPPNEAAARAFELSVLRAPVNERRKAAAT